MTPLWILITIALDYCFSRALIFEWLWKRYPKKLDTYMLCAACSGFAVSGLTSLALGFWLKTGPFGTPWCVFTPIVCAFAGIVLTPVGLWSMMAALRRIHELDRSTQEDDAAAE